MSDTISLQALARFSELDGAAALIDAYSRIPPGPLRANLVQQAAIIADQYTGGPLSMTLAPVAGAKGKPAPIALAPPTRTGREPPTAGDPRAQAVNMRLKGKTHEEIAEATGLTIQQLYSVFYAARKAGVPLPKVSKVTDSQQGSKKWHTDFELLTGQGKRAVERAAAERRVAPQVYLDRRVTALKLAQEGEGYDAILKATGEKDPKVVSAWISAARQAGFQVPYITNPLHGHKRADSPVSPPQAPPEAAKAPKEPDPEPEPAAPAQAARKRVFPAFSELSDKQRTPILFAAARRKLTPAAYQDLRETIVDHRLANMTPKQIAAVTGQPAQFIKDTMDLAQDRGVVFPRLTKDGGASDNAQAEPQELETAQ